jgi:hypothetical protein
MRYFIPLLFIAFTACTYVQPNYGGVLMENWGKSGKSDYSAVSGKVPTTFSPGTELFQVPMWEQRASFEDNGESVSLKLKAADNTEFSSKPMYSYEAIKTRTVDLVFQNSRLGSGDEFMRKLENNVLEPRIYDIMKEESRKYITDTLMANGGSLKFEKSVEVLVKKAFEEVGLDLKNFSCQLEFSQKVKDKIDNRNEVNTNITVLDQQILEQRKRNELATLKAEEGRIQSAGLTPQLLQKAFIDKWDGHSALYGNTPVTLLKNN